MIQNFFTIGEIDFDKLIYFLFNENVNKESILVRLDNSIIETVETKLISKVRKRVHTNYKFTPDKFKSIYFPFEMDCIGINGSLIGAKMLQFDKSRIALDKEISHYFTLISTLTSKYNKSLQDNNFFLISQEPKNIGSDEHQLWESIKRNEIIDVKYPEESNIIADLIIEKKATTFLNH